MPHVSLRVYYTAGRKIRAYGKAAILPPRVFPFRRSRDKGKRWQTPNGKARIWRRESNMAHVRAYYTACRRDEPTARR